MGRLEEWYGVDRARHIRAKQRLNGFDGVEELSAYDKGVLSVKMKAYLASVRAAIAWAQTKVAAANIVKLLVWGPALAPWVSYPEDVRNATRSALGSLLVMTDNSERSIQDVLAGTLQPAKWFAGVEETQKGIDRILDTMEENDYLSQFSASLSDKKRAVNEILDKVNSALPLVSGIGLAGVLLVGALILVPVARAYLTAPLAISRGRRVDGYHPRRRRSRR